MTVAVVELPSPAPAPNGPLAVSIQRAAELLSVHPNTVRRRLKDGTLRSIQFGARVLVPISSIERLLGQEVTA